ncbi:hypothetical protein DSCO28_07850 [Desulfosarcina ovata subsp. sediminis]|uniref:Uncharacterized protein n=1 Tax=Desulfosarcina ovata subsp. sediminis TaxID=885957 RepID=A0A5K7ZKQ0_9BACT|nr:hypothetical protein [Desulfosarcina ovata]BBO80219.1 hypothetical protein DSCO28_07850 [Desulfosarcina ovata subsp. sediminis]
MDNVFINIDGIEFEIDPNTHGYWSAKGHPGAFVDWSDMNGKTQARLIQIRDQIKALVEEGKALMPDGFNSDLIHPACELGWL